MPAAARQFAEDAAEGLTVLVVDDSASQRRVLALVLRKMGYHVLEADGGEAALEVFDTAAPSVVVSDWMMPGMNGLDLCRAIRERQVSGYTYFILLTSKSETDDIAHGLDAGADDFLTKPVEKEELRARLAAGMRILQMEQSLVEKSRTISVALEEIKTLYSALNRDLRAAEELQRSLLPAPSNTFGEVDISILLKSSGHLGGDLVSYFPVNEFCLGFYALDVCGHGIASALMTARVSSLLSRAAPGQNLAVSYQKGRADRPVEPSLVAHRLNAVVQKDMETDLYFTMIIGHINTVSGRGRMTQAGHPHPVIQRANGTVERIGEGGPPIGLIPEMEYHSFDFELAAGDRLIVASDGISECEDPEGTQLDDAGLHRILMQLADRPVFGVLPELLSALAIHRGSAVFDDDISAIAIERRAKD